MEMTNVKTDTATQVEKQSTDIPQDWYFTFGCNQAHEGHYHVIHGTFNEAREKMFHRFGAKWAMQYDSAEKAGITRWNLKEIK